MAINSTLRGLSTLGARLIKERERLNWSREDMANHGGVSRASQRLYDASDRVPSLIYLLQLAKNGADFNFLLSGERKQEQTNQHLMISEATAAKAFRLACHMWQSESSRVKTEDDAEELFLSLLRQMHNAESPGMDLEAIVAATNPEIDQ